MPQVPTLDLLTICDGRLFCTVDSLYETLEFFYADQSFWQTVYLRDAMSQLITSQFPRLADTRDMDKPAARETAVLAYGSHIAIPAEWEGYLAK